MDRLTEVQNKLKQLREKYCDAKDRSQELIDIDAAKMTEAQAAELRGLNAKMKTLKDQILPLVDEENRLQGFDPSKLTGETWDPDGRQEVEQRGGMIADRSYRAMFGEPARSEFRGAGEFLEIIASGRHDSRLQRASMVEGTPSLGGFVVPEQVSQSWWDDSLPAEVVRPRCLVWPMTSETMRVPAWDAADRSTGKTHGGIGVEWLTEATAGVEQVARVRKMLLQARKCGIFVDCSSELLDDGIGLQEQLKIAMRRSLSYGLDDAFLFGTGAGQPLGALAAGCCIEVAGEAGQVASTVVYENVLKMYARMHPEGQMRSVWLANPGLLPSLLSLTLAIGTSGAAIPILREQNGEMTLLGRPVVVTDVMKAPGTAGDFALADFGCYAIGLRKDLSIDQSIHPGFKSDLVSFRILARVDGMPTWDTALTPKNGTDTLAPFVRLGAR